MKIRLEKPSPKPRNMMNLNLDESDMSALIRLSHKTGKNRTRLLREAIRMMCEQHGVLNVEPLKKFERKLVKEKLSGIQRHFSYYQNMSLDELLRK